MTTSLRTRFSAIIILLAIVPQILAGIILSNLAFDSLEEQSLILLQETAANVGNQIEAFILDAERELILLDEVYGLGTLDKESQRKVLNSLLLNNRIYQELILLDKAGREQIHLSRSSVVFEPVLKLRDNEEEYLFPIREKSTFFGPVQFNATTNEPLTKIAVPILDPQSGEVDFVLVASVRYKPVWDLLAGFELPNQLELFVVDENGQVIAHPNPTVVLRGTQFDMSDKDGRTLGLSGQDSVSGSYTLQLGQQELFVIAQQPVSSALMLAVQYLQVTTGIMVVSLLAAAGLGVLAIRQIIVPIEKLASTAQAISAGELTRRVSVNSRDEIGDLALAFNSMTRQLGGMINTLEQRVEERTQDLQEALLEQKESEERYRRLIETSPDAITLTDLEGTILFCNPQAARLQGLDRPKEMIGRNAFEFVAPENAQQAIENARKTLEMGSVRNVEYISVKVDGTRFPVELSASVILDPEGKPNALIGVVRDITERRRTEEALRLSEERYRTLAQNLPDSALLLIDQDLRFIIADGPEIEATGFSREMLEGKTLQEALPPEFAKLVEPNMRRTLAGERFSAELPYEDRFYRYSCVPLRDDADNVVRAMILATNITQLRKTEDALKDSQRRLSTALRTTNVGVWEWDMRTNEAYWSDENYLVMGLEPGSVESKYENWAKCLHPEDLPAAEAKVTEAVNSKSELNIEFRVVWPDGSIHWINDIGSMLVDEDTGQPLGMYGIQMDITERKQAEEDIQRHLDELTAISNASQLLIYMQSPEMLAQIVIDVLEKILGYDYAAVILVDEDGEGMTPFALSLQGQGGEFFEEDKTYLQKKNLRVGKGITGWVALHGESIRLGNTRQDPRYLAVRTDIQSELCVPLRMGDKIIGVVNVETVHPNAYSESDQYVLETIAAQISIAIQNARLLDELQRNTNELERRVEERTAQLEQYYREQAATEERQRLARELHDTVSQTLFSTSLIAESLLRMQARDPDTLLNGLHDLVRLTRGALAEMRTLLLELRPTAIRNLRLNDLLRQLVAGLTGRTQLMVEVELDEDHTVPVDVRLTFFRLVQEAMNNIVKHAHAKHVTLRRRDLLPAPVSRGKEPLPGLEIIVSDDGQGFNPQSVLPGHYGLGIMRERVDAIGGELTIKSRPGQGTEIKITWRGNFVEERQL